VPKDGELPRLPDSGTATLSRGKDGTGGLESPVEAGLMVADEGASACWNVPRRGALSLTRAQSPASTIRNDHAGLSVSVSRASKPVATLSHFIPDKPRQTDLGGLRIASSKSTS